MTSYRVSFLLFIIHSIFSQSIDEKPTTCPNTCTTFEVALVQDAPGCVIIVPY